MRIDLIRCENIKALRQRVIRSSYVLENAKFPYRNLKCVSRSPKSTNNITSKHSTYVSAQRADPNCITLLYNAWSTFAATFTKRSCCSLWMLMEGQRLISFCHALDLSSNNMIFFSTILYHLFEIVYLDVIIMCHLCFAVCSI